MSIQISILIVHQSKRDINQVLCEQFLMNNSKSGYGFNKSRLHLLMKDICHLTVKKEIENETRNSCYPRRIFP